MKMSLILIRQDYSKSQQYEMENKGYELDFIGRNKKLLLWISRQKSDRLFGIQGYFTRGTKRKSIEGE